MGMTYVLAVDPGKTTGWATLRGPLFLSGQTPWYEFLEWFESQIRTTPEMTVVSESFTITPATIKKSPQQTLNV